VSRYPPCRRARKKIRTIGYRRRFVNTFDYINSSKMILAGRNWVHLSTRFRLCPNIRQMEFPTCSGPGNAGMLYDQPLRPRMSLSNIVDIHVPCVRCARCVLQYSRGNLVMCLDERESRSEPIYIFPRHRPFRQFLALIFIMKAQKRKLIHDAPRS